MLECAITYPMTKAKNYSESISNYALEKVDAPRDGQTVCDWCPLVVKHVLFNLSHLIWRQQSNPINSHRYMHTVTR